MVWIPRTHHLAHTVDAHRLRIAVVEKDLVPHPHVVPHEVAGLIVAHPIPAGRPMTLQVSDGVDTRFRFHQPVTFAPCHNPSQTGYCVPQLAPPYWRGN